MSGPVYPSARSQGDGPLMEEEVPGIVPFEPLQDAVEQVLTRTFKEAITVNSATLLTAPARRNRIWRCQLRSAVANVPAAVIIKQVRPDEYDPAKVDSWDTARFFNDWAGAQFLSEVAPQEGHGPKFYGADLRLGFIALEDLGDHISLVTPLLEGNAASASAALISFAKRLGAMHASAMGQEEAYTAIRNAISSEWVRIGKKPVEVMQERRVEQVAEFVEICTGLGVNASEAAQQELETALLHLDEPGPFLTFLHCDPCPDNNFYQAPELRMIDFEFSSFGHALCDGIYGRVPFPTCWCANMVPAEIVKLMEDVYRAELVEVCPEVKDDRRFLQEASAVAASWTLRGLKGHLTRALKEDRDWGIAGTRARILSRILMFLDTAHSADQMPALRDVYTKVLTQLHRLWPDASPLPVYPAFRTRV